MNIAFCFIIAYIFGAIPSGFVLGKLFYGINIREHGSKNIGATNTFRVLGAFPGILSFIFDFCKGFFSIQIGRWLLSSKCGSSPDLFSLLLVIIGLLSILGHVFPIYLKFHGGKGVATGAGVFVAIMPYAFIIAFSSFIITLLISRFVSLSSIIAVICFFLAELFFNIPDFQEIPYLVFSAIIMILIIIRHKGNIDRLIKGTESKIKFKKK